MTHLLHPCPKKDAGVTKAFTKGHLFVTRSAVSLEELGITSSCRQYRNPLDEFKSYPKGIMGTTPKVVPALAVLFSKQRGRYGVAIKIDSSANNLGSSKAGVFERYVTELSLDCTEPLRVDPGTLGTGRPVALVQ